MVRYTSVTNAARRRQGQDARWQGVAAQVAQGDPGDFARFVAQHRDKLLDDDLTWLTVCEFERAWGCDLGVYDFWGLDLRTSAGL